jgi:hypothetical protein
MPNKFETSRRGILLGGATAALLPIVRPSALLAQTTPPKTTYYSSLVGGYTPKSDLTFAGQTGWRAAAGSTWNSGMDHSLRLSSQKKALRVELRDTPRDNTDGDEDGRRSELKGIWKLPNAAPLWGAFSFIHHRWADPAGMAELYGGVYGQIHMGPFGGSPAVAFRRHKSGDFMVTTRGELNTSNTKRYKAPLAFGAVHDIVYRAVMHPTHGELTVWLNGLKIVDIKGESIGSSLADYIWHIGAYFSGGITCPIVAEFANHVYPWQGDLSARITRRPTWPIY